MSLYLEPTTNIYYIILCELSYVDVRSNSLISSCLLLLEQAHTFLLTINTFVFSNSLNSLIEMKFQFIFYN